jgi:hypothetical protein
MLRHIPLVQPRAAVAAVGGSLSGVRLAGRALKTDALRPLDAFEHRHLGPRPSDVTAMLSAVGKYKSLEDLCKDAVPAQIRAPVSLPGPPLRSDHGALWLLRAMMLGPSSRCGRPPQQPSSCSPAMLF